MCRIYSTKIYSDITVQRITYVHIALNVKALQPFIKISFLYYLHSEFIETRTVYMSSSVFVNISDFASTVLHLQFTSFSMLADRGVKIDLDT